MARYAVILPAAGKSSRFGDREKKPFTTLDGRAVWLRSVELFVTRADVVQCLLVVAPGDLEMFRNRYQANLAFLDVQIAPGGGERFESVGNALRLLKPEAEYVAVHDAVRPCLTSALVDAVFAQAAKCGAALLAVPCNDTLKRVDAQHRVQETVSRRGLWLAQTPQVFKKEWLLEAYAKRAALGKDVTVDAQLVEAAGHAVAVVEGSPANLKITTKADLALAELILKTQNKPKPGGAGHPFAEEEMWGGRG
jgi:2-C-methyl-D-erythritol 4-phosphate cytidylyltransferase